MTNKLALVNKNTHKMKPKSIAYSSRRTAHMSARVYNCGAQYNTVQF